MIKIRLTRKGKKNDPFYRIVAIESSKKREGEPLEVLGYWHPKSKDKKIDEKAIEDWVKKGAQISKGVKELLGGKKKK
jgi:small subunit ribosomal protein S16